MSYLDQIVADVERTGSHNANWSALVNIYFPGENRIHRVEEWARKHGLIACFDYKEQSIERSLVRSVTFVRAGALPTPNP